MKACSISECTNTTRAWGWCNKHYKRWRSTGDPLLLKAMGPRNHKPKLCKFDGCKSISRSRGWCQKHYGRWNRNGDPSVTLISASRPIGYLRVDGGYANVKFPDHPLANKWGWVMEHRKVMYDLHGIGPHSCWSCGTPLSWGAKKGNKKIAINHMNENGLDNRAENLVFSCLLCNRQYSLMLVLMDQFGLKERKPTPTTLYYAGRKNRAAGGSTSG